MKFLIDECLSERLAKSARARGHVESSHVAWIGKRGMKDWNLIAVIVAGDWTFVTRNASDFRGPADSPGTRGLYRFADIHAGLICLTGSDMDLQLQSDLFEVAMDMLQGEHDLVNQVLEVSAEARDATNFDVRRYKLPKD